MDFSKVVKAKSICSCHLICAEASVSCAIFLTLLIVPLLLLLLRFL
jgi:hypothetical protein